MKNFLLKKIIENKLKYQRDEIIINKILNEKNKRNEFTLDQDNIFLKKIKESYSNILLYKNKQYLNKINNENKNSRILLILQKLIFKKQNLENKIIKCYFNKLKIKADAYKMDKINKRNNILKILINKITKVNNTNKIKELINKWNLKAKLSSKIIGFICNRIYKKEKQAELTLHNYFEIFKIQAKRILSKFNSLNVIFVLTEKSLNRVKYDNFKNLFKNFHLLEKWNSKNKNISKIIKINCNIPKNTYYNNNKFIEFSEADSNKNNNDNNLNENVEGVILKKIFKFKKINYLWKLCDKNKNMQIKYYFFKFLNNTNANFLEDLKINSLKWNHTTTNYSDLNNNINYNSNSDDEENVELIEKTNIVKNHIVKTKAIEGNMFFIKDNVEDLSRLENQDKIVSQKPKKLEKSYESGVNRDLIIQNYKQNLIKINIQPIDQQNIIIDNKINFNNSKKEIENSLTFSSQNSEIFKNETESLKINQQKLLLTEEEKEKETRNKNLKEKLLNKLDKGLKILRNFSLFKKQNHLNSLIRNMRYKILDKFSLKITKTLKKFVEKNKKAKLNNLNEKCQNSIIINEDIELNNSSSNLDDSRYLEKIIELVKVIQLYNYNKENPINKFNYLIRVFNRWRKSTNDNSNCNILNKQNQNSQIINLKNKSKINEKVKRYSSLNMYSKYLENLKTKFEKLLEHIQRFSLKSFVAEISNKKIIENNTNLNINNNSKKKVNFTSEKNIPKLEMFSFDIKLCNTINYNYTFNENNNYNYNSGNTLNYKIPSFNRSFTTRPGFEDNISLANNSINIQVNKSSFNFDVNNNNNYNSNVNNSFINTKKSLNHNQSFSQSNNNFNTLNNCVQTNNNQSVYSKNNVTYNSEIQSAGEEHEEVDEVKISCAIEIQNFWREFFVQKYILNYAEKLKLMDKFIKRNNYKLKNMVLFYFEQWKKKLFKMKLNKKIILIQRFHRSKKLHMEMAK